jgi:hypothetical protein
VDNTDPSYDALIKSFEASQKRVKEKQSTNKDANWGAIGRGLLGNAWDMVNSMFGPADVNYMKFLVNNRGSVMRFQQVVAIGQGRNSALLGGMRVLDEMLTKGEITDKELSHAMHALLVETSGEVVGGQQSSWQRMIKAGVLAMEDPLKDGIERQKIVEAIKEQGAKVPVKLEEMSEQGQATYKKLLDGIRAFGSGVETNLQVEATAGQRAPAPQTPPQVSTNNIRVPNL